MKSASWARALRAFAVGAGLGFLAGMLAPPSKSNAVKTAEKSAKGGEKEAL